MSVRVPRGRVWWGIVIVVVLTALFGGFVASPWGLGVRSRMRVAIHVVRAVKDRGAVVSTGDFTNVVFLHHSTGRGLIKQGEVRERLTEAGFRFWDHDYNSIGLTRPDGVRTGYSYSIPDDNTDPDGLARIFSQHLYSKPLNAFSGLMQHEVIVFKSCFPTSNILSDDQLEQYKTYYRSIRDVMDQHPDKVFVVMTPPPLNPVSTTAAAAGRVRAFADWLKSDDFLAGHSNVFTFDLFDLLAAGESSASDFNMLREVYREGDDSHPSRSANETIGPLLADFIVETVETYRAELAE